MPPKVREVIAELTASGWCSRQGCLKMKRQGSVNIERQRLMEMALADV